MKRSSCTIIVLFAVVLALFAVLPGCSSPATSADTPASVPSAPPAPEKTLSTLEPEQMILGLADLPGNYTLVNYGERNVSKIQPWMLNAGWKKGNYVMMQKNEPGSSVHPAIWHYVYKFPKENASQVVSWQADGLVVYDAQDDSNHTYTELAAPGIGNTSRAVSMADKNSPEMMTVIVFSKYDVYEELWCNATPVDYENLKKVAAIAAAKIR
ncbi:hypothetical protein [Methanoregula sp.]|uniref:hypothetical protein n=1 Tax=Methanoregula sp. TaxID=2052170 RepID=UPI0023764519|nr:hypothetical protein [Methanoregula sp.]MDD1686046.1 hypothetical protein [Methanoregula sp.]